MMPHEIQQDSWKQLAGEAAAKLIEDGMVIGLGSGSTAAYLIYALARRIQAGLSIVGAVPTSKVTGELASNLGVPLTDLDTHPELDLDCTFPGGITDPPDLENRIKRIVGVVETGLFLNMASQAIIGGPEGVKILS